MVANDSLMFCGDAFSSEYTRVSPPWIQLGKSLSSVRLRVLEFRSSSHH